MKTNVKKILATVLTLVMLLSCFAPAALAATKDDVYQYGKKGGYLAIGDSLSRGCGCTGFYLDENNNPVDPNKNKNDKGQYDLYYLRNVEGSITTQIAQAVGCEAPKYMEDQNATYWPFCYPGMTTGVALDLLGIDDGFTDTDLKFREYKDMMEFFGYEGSFEGVQGEKYVPGESGKCGNIVDLIGKADLITIQLGMCDVFYRAYKITQHGGFLADGLKLDMDNIGDLLKTASAEMLKGYAYWEKNFPTLLKYVRDNNPDATIVLVGAFNIVNQLTITDDMVFPVGTLFSSITDSMNKKYAEWAKEYDMLYADVSNTEILAAEKGWSLMGDFMSNTLIATHPSQLGYDYMTRKILEVLPSTSEVEKENGKYDIVVDLGRFNSVSKVSVNGKKVTDYELDGFVLTIKYGNANADTLTVEIDNGDGTISLETYTLKYTADGGYSAYRLYGNNDEVGTFFKPFKLLFDLIKQLFNKIFGGLFK